MTLDQLRPRVKSLLDPWVRAADALGLSPNGVSTIAFLLAVAAGGAFAYAGPAFADAPLFYAVGATCVALNGWLDVVDGELARAQDVASEAGDMLDHVLDRYADLVIIAGFAAGIGRYDIGLAAVTGVLMTSYLGTQAQAVGLDRVYAGYLGRADRLALSGVVGYVAAVFPGAIYGLTVVGWLLVVFAVVGHLTALQRFSGAWKALS
ncbi:CDP-alcohol phosphatidyltransferase family protein [Haloarchaeobius amylolyticus]|uniref:CDP-alcohol phosphatidyltransferase family protein n=1 Tax=Haloarchaeobius amylolyticus TaxID=1198296 RepID=UPI0022706D27|nr:CDP-alcohol phosphatidyltransferase family protein [Haloarchaeobius amylolyticus]